MTNNEFLELAGIVANIARHAPELSGHYIGARLLEIRKRCNTARRLCEPQCNGIQRWRQTENNGRGGYVSEWTDDDQATLDRSLEWIDKASAALAAQVGCEFVSHNRDPRGPYGAFRTKDGAAASAAESIHVFEFRL